MTRPAAGHPVPVHPVRRVLLLVVVLVACLPLPAASATRCGADVPGLARTTVDTGSVRLDVATGGPPGAPVVVLLHGFPETWRTWRGVALDLAADHRVVVPDLRGAGCSDFGPEPDPDARTLAGDLAGLSARLGLAPAIVVGHDMGAMPAYAWARDRPDQVRHLVLSGGGVPGLGLEALAPPHVAAFAAAPPGRLAAAVRGREREVLGAFVGDPAVTASGSLDDAVRAYAAPGRYDAAMGRYRALPRDAARNRADRGPLAMPATALEGGAPGISAATLPGADVVVVPGAGHYLQEDRPHETAAAIRAVAARR